MAKRFSPERLRSARNQAGYTQKEAAEVLNVSYQTYQYWEHGRQLPRADKLLKIIELFSKNLEDLVEEDGKIVSLLYQTCCYDAAILSSLPPEYNCPAREAAVARLPRYITRLSASMESS
jgi:transcriptional regulator with XRE-family HTH domain